MSMQWLLARAPGFSNLTTEEREAIVDFSLLWSLFEARVLDNAANAGRILGAVAGWNEAGTLQAEAYAGQLAYFRQRYFANAEFTHRFHALNLRPNRDKIPLVRSVISGVTNDCSSEVATVLIIILRYRNNLFHGMKWQYELAGQLDNFTNANNALMTALEQHGRLQD
jgi:predicted NAD/FAD-binding protein